MSQRTEMEKVINHYKVVAHFTSLVSSLNCVTLGLDACWNIWVRTHDNGHTTITIDCSDKFWFATGDNEGIGSFEDLELFKKVVYWFLEKNYNETDWYKEYYPTFEDYIYDDGFPTYCLSDEEEEVMQYWLAMCYCMLIRGHEVHPHYWRKCPEWLQNKLTEAGVEPHPYRKDK